MNTKLSEDFKQGTCPVCGISWDGGSIVETFIKQRDEGDPYRAEQTDEEIRKEVMGWTDDEILAFVDQNMSFDSEEEMQKFLMQDRRILDLYLYQHFGVEISGSYSPPYRWSRIIGIEIQGMCDGISYWRCPDCETTWNRWTREEETIKEVPTRPGYSDKITS